MEIKDNFKDNESKHTQLQCEDSLSLWIQVLENYTEDDRQAAHKLQVFVNKCLYEIPHWPDKSYREKLTFSPYWPS